MKRILCTGNMGVFEKYKFSVSYFARSDTWMAFVEIFPMRGMNQVAVNCASKDAAMSACEQYLDERDDNDGQA